MSSSIRLNVQVIDAVLATDMKQHFSLVSLFNTKFSAPSPSAAEGSSFSRSRAGTAAAGGGEAAAGGNIRKSAAGMSPGLDLVKMDDEMRSLVMQVRRERR